VGSVVLANWATSQFGFIPVGFGQMATAGTLAAGVALAARDAIQDSVGKVWMLLFLTAAAVLSYLVADPRIATASLVAFVVSETLDFIVYTPLRSKSRLGDRRWAVAVVASDVVGIVADTIVFIGVAFGMATVWQAMPGQFIGKAWATVAYLILIKAVAVVVLRQSDRQPEGA
jgi:uncharacterized PurR-regulated membrane protein YhhQ (DUF165 family)